MKIGKNAIILLVAFVLLVIVLEFDMQVMVHNRDERGLAEAFIRQNNKVSELVGGIKDIDYLKEGVEVVSYSNRTEGVYRFKVVGNKTTEELSIYWTTKDGETTSFSRIDLSNPWQQAQVVWAK